MNDDSAGPFVPLNLSLLLCKMGCWGLRRAARSPASLAVWGSPRLPGLLLRNTWSRQVRRGAGQHADPQAQPGVQPRPVRREPGLGVLRSARWVAGSPSGLPCPLPGLQAAFQPLGPAFTLRSHAAQNREEREAELRTPGAEGIPGEARPVLLPGHRSPTPAPPFGGAPSRGAGWGAGPADPAPSIPSCRRILLVSLSSKTNGLSAGVLPFSQKSTIEL